MHKQTIIWRLVNWYLTNNDTKTDGKFIEYLQKDEFVNSDAELADFLKSCLDSGKRNVSEIGKFERFSNFEFYDDILELNHIKALSEAGRRKRGVERTKWFEDSLTKLSSCNLIFCDPDNGIETKAMSKVGTNSVKYVMIDEIRTMVEKGHSLVVYNHRDRSTEESYISRFVDIKKQLPKYVSMRIVRFNRYSARDYLIFMQENHKIKLNEQIDAFLNSKDWKRHFKEIEIK